ncbi:MAG: hypothetical protein R3A51_13150 [Nannocystaceae bacterium]|nr:DUF2063 domain-containing protein [Myxococcales bacterium]
MTVARDPGAPLTAFAAILTQRSAPTRAREDLAGLIDGAAALDEADRAAMLAASVDRYLAYRTMVHGRLRRTIREWIPRTIRRVGDRYPRDFAAFMEDPGPRTPYLRCVPGEFVAWALPRWRDDPALPPYLEDLARYELTDEDLRNEPCGGEAPTGLPLALDRPLRIDGAVRLQRHAYAVHLLPRAVDDASAPEARDTHLLVYRDRSSHQVRYLELTPRAAAVITRLLAGEGVQAALVGAAAELEVALDDEFLAAMVHFFADLSEREVLLGAEP